MRILQNYNEGAGRQFLITSRDTQKQTDYNRLLRSNLELEHSHFIALGLLRHLHLHIRVSYPSLLASMSLAIFSPATCEIRNISLSFCNASLRISFIFMYINQKIMSGPSTPKKITWIIGLASGILGIIGHYAHVQILTEYNYVLLLFGFLVLAAGTTFRGM